MSLASNSTLSLYSQCPPGLIGESCQLGSCNSTFVSPSSRVAKPATAQSCPTCDADFGGINCNICNTLESCSNRQQAVGRGTSGVTSGSLTTINNTLTCNTQPKAITQTNVQCSVHQPTFSSLFPGTITLTAIKVAEVPNFQTTGLSSWNAAANSTLAQVWLDGVEQFYCQATGCKSSNITTPAGSSAPFGTDNWNCDTLKCYCIPGTKVCTGAGFPLAPIIDSLSGGLDFNCDYIDPSTPFASTNCAFSSSALNGFVGPSGLPLSNCTFGQCLSQYDVEQDWADSSAAQKAAKGSHLSGGVIGGLTILGVAVAALLLVMLWGYYLVKKARKAPREPDGKAIGLCWEGITYQVKPLHRKMFALNKRSDQKVKDDRSVELGSLDESRDSGAASPGANLSNTIILDDVTCSVAPGSLAVIIGASGAGKSSLVDILGGRYKTGQVSGQIHLLNDVDQRDSKRARRRIATVDQDDSINLPGYLTVREALLFAAELSNPENVPRTEQEVLVDSVIQTLGLMNIAHSRIGDARTRGISGGERRRVSLGTALVARPKILIADEATSGLDAVSAHRIMTALRKLASGPEGNGTTVIATLHQPSSEIFHMADHCILLDRGTVAFQGKPSQALDFCRSNGTPVPEGYNVADSLLSHAFNRKRKSAASEKDSSSLYTSTKVSLHAKLDTPITTFMTQMHVLLKRSLLLLSRDLSGFATHIIGSVVVALFVGGCFYQVKLDIAGFQNRVGAIFFVYILLLFASLSALTGLHKCKLLMMRERANNLYSSWTWLTSHLIHDLILLRAIPAILITLIIYWMVGLRSNPSIFFKFLLLTVIFNWAISLYQMILGAILEDVSVAILYGGLFILFNINFAGFILNLNNIPGVLRWLKWICPSKYALEGVAVEQLDGLQVIDNVGGVPITASVSLFAFKLFGFEENSYYRNLIVLACGFTIGFGLILFGTVHLRMKERR